MICDLWQNEIDSVHVMRVVNTDYKYYLAKKPDKCLQDTARAKKNIYLEACLQQHCNFSPFVASVDGILDVEAADNLKRISRRLATKWQQPNLRTCGYVKSRITINLVWATHQCIQWSKVPEHWISVQRPQWEDGDGLNSSDRRARENPILETLSPQVNPHRFWS